MADEAPSRDDPALGAPYLGTIASDRHLHAPAILGVGYPRVKRQVMTVLAQAGRDLAPPLIHPSATVGGDTIVGSGTVIAAGVIVTTAAELGRGVSLHPGALLGHDVAAGDWVAVMPGAAVSGGVTLGEGSFVGANAAIIQGVSVGDWATVGAGAVVLSDVPAGATVVGVPARMVRSN